MNFQVKQSSIEAKITRAELKMTTNRHGLSIGIERTQSSFFMTMKAIGTLTHEDYESITPMINSALASVKEAKIKMLIDGTEMEGW